MFNNIDKFNPDIFELNDTPFDVGYEVIIEKPKKLEYHIYVEKLKPIKIFRKPFINIRNRLK